MPRFGQCLQCDRPEDDIDKHLAERHRGRKPSDPELYSGTIECKECRNAIKLPRIAPGKEAIDGVPNHNCDPARPVKNADGIVTGWINSTGMDVRHYQLVLDPIQ